jgi:hypothetical protein
MPLKIDPRAVGCQPLHQMLARHEYRSGEDQSSTSRWNLFPTQVVTIQQSVGYEQEGPMRRKEAKVVHRVSLWKLPPSSNLGEVPKHSQRRRAWGGGGVGGKGVKIYPVKNTTNYSSSCSQFVSPFVCNEPKTIYIQSSKRHTIPQNTRTRHDCTSNQSIFYWNASVTGISCYTEEICTTMHKKSYTTLHHAHDCISQPTQLRTVTSPQNQS